MTNDEIRTLIQKEHSDISEWIPLIEQYIYEHRNIKVSINSPRNMIQHELYAIAWKTVYKYYANKLGDYPTA